MPSFYVPNLTETCKKIAIKDGEINHISKVFRHKIGDVINLNSGSGVYVKAEILQMSKKEILCQVLEAIPKSKYTPNIAVAFALLRNKNDNLLVEKLTELGVSTLFPFESDFTIRKASKNTTEKFNITAVGAIKQCDNAYLPDIFDCKMLASQIEEVMKEGYIPVIASEVEQVNTIIDVFKQNEEQALCIFIGPEGGFSKEEFELFSQKGFVQYKLGINILRAETAAICAVSQLIAKYL
jgi:16S rRNA (uracil1498-N3)-methyltransferase